MQSVPPTPGIRYRHEEDAEGVVGSVFRDVRTRMAFVPAIFKVLAGDPEALLPAWLQARALYDHSGAKEASARLQRAARPRLPYGPSEAVREATAPFAEELPAMLLIVTSLGLALDGVLPLQPRPPADLPEPGPVPPPEVPDRGEHPLFDEIRAVYGTEHVPSMFRSLAARGLLEEPWQAIGPFLAGGRGLALVGEVEAAAEEEALRFPEVACFDAESARPVLDQFRRALPKNLVFATACS